MKKRLMVATVAMTAFLAGEAAAASIAAAGTRDSLAVPTTLGAWSVGFDYDSINRDIKLRNDQDATLEADTYAGFLGYDATSWLTLFLTMGSTRFDSSNSSQDGGDQFKWSGGLGVNLWHFDIRDPEFMTGQLSIRCMLEYAQYKSGDTDYEVQWNEFSAALPIGYEIFTETMQSTHEVPYSLLLSAGPVLSVLDGDMDQSGGSSVGFDEDSSLGVMGRADVFWSQNLSTGGQVQYFGDEYTATGSLRYHFR